MGKEGVTTGEFNDIPTFYPTMNTPGDLPGFEKFLARQALGFADGAGKAAEQILLREKLEMSSVQSITRRSLHCRLLIVIRIVLVHHLGEGIHQPRKSEQQHVKNHADWQEHDNRYQDASTAKEIDNPFMKKKAGRYPEEGEKCAADCLDDLDVDDENFEPDTAAAVKLEMARNIVPKQQDSCQDAEVNDDFRPFHHDC